MTVYIAPLLLLAAIFTLHQAKRRPKLTPVAIIFFVVGVAMAIASVAKNVNPVKYSEKKYHNLHHKRQGVQAQMMAKTLAELKDPPRKVLFFHNRVDMFCDTHFAGLQQGAKEAYNVAAFSKGDPQRDVSGYSFSARDVEEGMAANPDTDIAVFDGVPPPGMMNVPEFKTRKVRWAIMSVPEERDVSAWFAQGLVAASFERPPMERGSVKDRSIPKALEKAYAGEYRMVTSPE